MMRTKDNISSSVATIASCAAALLMFMPLGAKAQSASASDDGEVDRTARNALTRLRSVPGLSATFLEVASTFLVSMEPVSR